MERITFQQLVELFQKLEKTPSRNDMTSILVEFFKKAEPQDAQIACYMIQGGVAPFFLNSEFNYSEKSILNLLSNVIKAEGLRTDPIKKRSEVGDIGETIKFFTEKMGYESKGMLLSEVYESLWKIVNTKGTGSVENKGRIISDLLVKSSPLEAKFIARIVCGELRLGLNAKTLLDVFSFLVNEDKSFRSELDRAYGVCADIGYICSKVVGVSKNIALDNIHNIKIIPGVPILPRLVERVGSFEEVFERLGESVLVQSKFDGLRCQIHKFNSKQAQTDFKTVWKNFIPQESSLGLFGGASEDVEVKLFTRNLEDVTEMFPEIVEAAREVGHESFVLDSEILGWNYEKDTFLTYQETMQRRRKYEIGEKRNDIPVKAMAFDLLYLNGKDLISIDTADRINILEKEISDTREGIHVERTRSVDSLESLNGEFRKALDRGLEGIIVKQRSGQYLPGVRNFEWIKLKKSMDKGFVDTVDLVAVGYYLGSGKRSSLGVGAVLGALYNSEEDRFEVLCKVGTGFSDEQLKELNRLFENKKLVEKPKNIVGGELFIPDVWVDPSFVFTVEADEITRNLSKSEASIASGLSLRFPRVTVFGRDKGPTEATSVRELVSMYELQGNLS